MHALGLSESLETAWKRQGHGEALVARRELGEDGVEGDGGGGDSRGRAGLGHRLVAVWARVRAAFGDG